MFALTVEAWRPRVRAHANGLPVEFLLQWMTMESGGNPAALGSQYEVGLFQINMADGPAFGGSVDTLHRNFAAAGAQKSSRALTEDEKELQVTTGVAMVSAYRDKSQTQLASVGADWPQGSSDFWSLVKLQHALPAIPYYFLRAFKAERGAAPSSWSEWTHWLNGLSSPQVTSVSAAVGRYYGSNGKPALSRFTSNAERAGAFGGVELLGGLVSATMLAVLIFAGALCALTLATAA